MVTYGI